MTSTLLVIDSLHDIHWYTCIIHTLASILVYSRHSLIHLHLYILCRLSLYKKERSLQRHSTDVVREVPSTGAVAQSASCCNTSCNWPLTSGCKVPRVVWGQESFLDGACVGVRARAAFSCALMCASRAMSALSCLKAAVMCQPITPCVVVLSQKLISMCAYTSTHTQHRTTHTHTQQHAQIYTQTEAHLDTETQKHKPTHAQINIYRYTYTYIYITYRYRYKHTGKYICMYMYT